MRVIYAAPLAMLAGCATTAEMAQAPPARVYQSAKARSAVAECLLDRVTDAELRPSRTDVEGTTTVAFESGGAMMHPAPAVYLFTIRDSGSGSAIEARRLGHASLAAAETCF